MRGEATGYFSFMTTLEVPADGGALAAASPQTAPFGPLRIEWDSRILRPRAWTTAQSHWAAALAPRCPEGPMLELFCGAGQIGLLAAALTGRPLVQVDRDEVAVTYARRNADAAGLTADVRLGAITGAIAPAEQFGIVILDPPWVRSERVEDFPQDPIGAIDGGADGLDQVVLGLGVALRHLHPDGHAVLQVGATDQADAVASFLRDTDWMVGEVRDYSPGGVLVDIARRTSQGGGER